MELPKTLFISVPSSTIFFLFSHFLHFPFFFWSKWVPQRQLHAPTNIKIGARISTSWAGSFSGQLHGMAMACGGGAALKSLMGFNASHWTVLCLHLNRRSESGKSDSRRRCSPEDNSAQNSAAGAAGICWRQQPSNKQPTPVHSILLPHSSRITAFICHLLCRNRIHSCAGTLSYPRVPHLL